MARPNVILILADGHRGDCAGFAGNPDVRTPNLDALAAHGLVFSQAICQSPLSGPSRATLMTGQYPAAHGVRDNRALLPKTAPALPGLLGGVGYHTACVGKMGLVPPRARYGFDVMRLAEEHDPGRNEDDYHKWLQKRAEKEGVEADSAVEANWDSFGAAPSPLPERFHSTTWIGDQAVRFIQRAREPFFLWVGFTKPHYPFDPPANWDQLYDPDALTVPPGWRCPIPETDAGQQRPLDFRHMAEPVFRRVLSRYYALISQIDKQIGRILATLTSRAHTNNVIVYAADHGDYMGQHGLVLKNGQSYDSVLRVPLVIAGVRGQRRGESDPALAELTDIPPTVLDAAGIEIPAQVQGRRLTSQLKRSGVPLRRAAFAEGPQERRVVRTRRWKLIQSLEKDFNALYDLRGDPHEFNNLYGQSEAANTQAKMKKALDAILARQGTA